MDLSTANVIVAPGLNGSPPEHWQSRWLEENASWVRTAPASWDEPELADWLAALDRAADAFAGKPVLVVAHSLGCWASTIWAAEKPERVAGLFLVGPPDVAALTNAGVKGFAEAVRPSTRSLVVSSRDDPYQTSGTSAGLAEQWGAGWVELDGLGHINASSGLGRWEQGHQLLTAFAAGLG